MGTVVVHYLENDRLAIGVRDHELVSDQTFADGGADAGPTPTELFVSSLAACVAHYAQRYLRRHHLPTAGLTVTAGYDLVEHPTRVGEIQLSVELPDGIPLDRRTALLAVASHCTVHNTLAQPSRVLVGLVEAPTPVAS